MIFYANLINSQENKKPINAHRSPSAAKLNTLQNLLNSLHQDSDLKSGPMVEEILKEFQAILLMKLKELVTHMEPSSLYSKVKNY